MPPRSGGRSSTAADVEAAGGAAEVVAGAGSSGFFQVVSLVFWFQK
jgi:hypothetical protein